MCQGRDLSAIISAITPLVLASELAWGDKDVDGIDSDAENSGLSPAARQPLWRMSEEEQQVNEENKLLTVSFVFVFRYVFFAEKRREYYSVCLYYHCHGFDGFGTACA